MTVPNAKSKTAHARLGDGLRRVGVAASAGVMDRLWRYIGLVLRENRQTNLVGARTEADMVVHVLDSLAPLRDVEPLEPVADLGSGAGLPGIAAAIAFPGRIFVLLEPRARRAQFLQKAVAELKLRTVSVEQVRAETAGRREFREHFRTVLTRAVAKPAVVLEYALPLLKKDGELIVYLGRQAWPTENELCVMRHLGGDLREAKRVAVPYLDAQRHVWIVRKIRTTPATYPRRSGIPKASPLSISMFPVEPTAKASAFDSILARELSGGGVFAVGGRVRDEVLAELGRTPPATLDLDYLVTGLNLDDIVARLSPIGRAELVGAAFGVIKFTLNGVTADIALPRREWSTGTHHRDFRVESSPNIPIETDLARRDFRINMMARDLQSGRLVDPYGGRSDLEARRLDILSPETFLEDPLRILRGCQLAARFDLSPSEASIDAMQDASHLLSTVAPERVADELTKLLERAPRPSVGLELLRHVGGLGVVLPELAEGWGVDQNQYHAHTVYYHSLYTCDASPANLVLRLAALFHDVGKPRTKDGPHFYNHQIVGAEMAREALTRLRFSNDVVERVCRLVAQHMYSAVDELTDAAVRRFIKRVGEENVDAVFALRHADVSATGLAPRDLDENARFEARVRLQLRGPHAFSIADLAIGGDDVIAIMRGAGMVDADFRGDRRVGAALAYVLERVLDEPARNEPATLRALVRAFFGICTTT